MIGSAIELGTVVAVYERGNSIDVLLPDGSRLANVQVMVPSGSDASGVVDLVDVGGPLDDTRWDITGNFARQVRAVIAFFDYIPVCMGFLLPQVSQMTFDRKNFRIERHASDVYSTINDAGDMETYHPSGTYLRIGASPAHEDLTGQDFDRRFKVGRNTGAAPHVHLQVANAGTPVATIDIDPSGNISIEHNGNLTVNTQGSANLTVQGEADVKAPSVTIDSPQTHMTGALTVDGALTFKGGMTGSGGSGATMKLTGSMTVTGGDVTVDGIGTKSHHHTAQGANAPTTDAQAS